MSSRYLEKLQSCHRQILRTRERVERLFQCGHISSRDIKSLYSGLFINAMTDFESYLEQLFISQLIHPSSRVVPRFSVRSTGVAYDILAADRPYIDWLPYDQTKKRAKRCFRGGGPFNGLDNADERQLSAMSIIRNALAHSSKHAIHKFQRNIISSLPLRNSQSNPVGYLRAQFSSSPVTSYFENHVLELRQIARKLDA